METENSAIPVFEQKTVTVIPMLENACVNGYAALGWALENVSDGLGKVDLSFKRDRSLRSKAELTRLEGQITTDMEDIAAMERNKTRTPSAVGLTVGVLGTIAIAGAVLVWLGGSKPLAVVLAAAGIAGVIAARPVYQKLRRNNIARLSPLIEQKYENIRSASAKAASLLDY